MYLTIEKTLAQKTFLKTERHDKILGPWQCVGCVAALILIGIGITRLSIKGTYALYEASFCFPAAILIGFCSKPKNVIKISHLPYSPHTKIITVIEYLLSHRCSEEDRDTLLGSIQEKERPAFLDILFHQVLPDSAQQALALSIIKTLCTPPNWDNTQFNYTKEGVLTYHGMPFSTDPAFTIPYILSSECSFQNCKELLKAIGQKKGAIKNLVKTLFREHIARGIQDLTQQGQILQFFKALADFFNDESMRKHSGFRDQDPRLKILFHDYERFLFKAAGTLTFEETDISLFFSRDWTIETLFFKKWDNDFSFYLLEEMDGSKEMMEQFIAKLMQYIQCIRTERNQVIALHVLESIKEFLCSQRGDAYGIDLKKEPYKFLLFNPYFEQDRLRSTLGDVDFQPFLS